MRRACVLLGLAGCFGQGDTLGLPCDVDSQCDLGQRCNAGKCASVGQDSDATTMVTSSEGTPMCDGDPITLAPLPTRTVLVLDRSLAAMEATWDDDNAAGTEPVERWPAVVAELSEQLPMNDAVLELGLALAPTMDACGVDALTVALAPMNAAALVEQLPGDAGGGAPFSAALGLAYDALRELEDPAARSVVLVVAGAASCVPPGGVDMADPDVVDVVAQAHADGIPTAVLGIDPSEAVDMTAGNGKPDGVSAHATALALADAGGLPHPSDGYYRARTRLGLAVSMRDALLMARGCRLPRAGALASSDTIGVSVDGVARTRRDSCDGDGFVVHDDFIELCGNACSAMKLDKPVTATACP
ncbi:MAG TPA: hypothetical protein VG755_09095 [Nannocystaceae bacterium]|nr:hypothetical protein [Nannocystaceae bacterium]